MINWESILPKKQDEYCERYGSEEFVRKLSRNEMRQDCLDALRVSEQKGEICKPLSVTQISVALKKEYPICPRCHKQSVAGAHMTSNDKRSLYCTDGSCSYEIAFEELTTPILRAAEKQPTTKEG